MYVDTFSGMFQKVTKSIYDNLYTVYIHICDICIMYIYIYYMYIHIITYSKDPGMS